MDKLNIDDYPQLTTICWNRQGGDRKITEQDAFNLYERNWRFVDADKLTTEELILIRRLTSEYGEGLIRV